MLFDPSRVIKGIDTLLQIIKYFEQEDLDELQKYGEIENLNELRDILKMAVEEDSLIGCKTA
ncbi:hypothetical protein D3C85_576590 [compost metagenome]